MVWHKRNRSSFEKICECGHGYYEHHCAAGNKPACDAKGCSCVRFKNFQKHTAAVPQVYKGRRYHSGFEAQHAAELDLLLMAGEVKEWKPQYELIFVSPLTKRPFGKHKIDFYVKLKDGSEEIHETKGREFAGGNWLRAIIEHIWIPMHPGFKYVYIKQGARFIP